MDLREIARAIIMLGVNLAVVGVIIYFGWRIGLFSKPPEDIGVRRGDWRSYVPLASSVILSVILTVLLRVVVQLFK